MTDDGISFDGYEIFEPGDPGYDELLPLARENRLPDEVAERPVDPEALAHVLHDAGLDAHDFLENP
ncbi:hypothetical protein KO481_15765 [Nocardia sp. NEAU-G5]|uniref:Uncharacterized protein n=1 Tax=Nocardia albiluteola TaxID=2842303 RepID=A0ABS6AY47_9NOCA|nr:hypothetical protein [Nocardia albiluteola]MBU3062975.1 hypothetical protein [Nocardia albiluteola]